MSQMGRPADGKRSDLERAAAAELLMSASRADLAGANVDSLLDDGIRSAAERAAGLVL
jgi:hypothetical protein